MKQKAIEMHYLLHSAWKAYTFSVKKNFNYEVRHQMARPVIHENGRKTQSVRSPFCPSSSCC